MRKHIRVISILFMGAALAPRAAEPQVTSVGPAAEAVAEALRSVRTIVAIDARELAGIGADLASLAELRSLATLGELAELGDLATTAAARTPVPPQRAAPPAAPQQATPPTAWAAQDPADSLYRAARESLNQGDNRRAAELFRQITVRHPNSTYAPDALYWEAYARYRIGGDEQLRQALAALDRQRTEHPDAATRSDASALATRIRGELARRGDSEAAEVVTKAATDPETKCSGADTEIRTAALNALLQMDAERAAPILRQVLERRDACSAPLRKKAVFLVSQKVTPETEDLLLQIARNDPDLDVRRSAVFYLSQVSTDRAVVALEEILRNSGDVALQERALFALSQHRSPRASQILRTYVEQANAPEELRGKAVFWIGQQRSAENASFLRDLFDRTTSEALKEKVLFSLSQRRGEGNERWLLDIALDSEQSIRTRKKALFWAGQSGAPIQELIGLYDRMSGREMKEQLIFVYSQRNETAAVDKMIEIARREQDVNLRKKAIFWLSQSKDPRVAAVLLELIGDE